MRGLWIVAAVVGLCGCPSAEIAGVTPAPEGEPVLTVHSKVSGLAHVPERCRVVAEFGRWRGTAPTPMFRGVEEPQSVYSEVRRWQRSAGGVPEGSLRVRFMYRNEVLDEQVFPAPGFSEASLDRQLYWPPEEPAQPAYQDGTWGGRRPPQRVR